MTVRPPQQLRHVMIDLETMGLRPNAAIVAIGAVHFDRERLLDEFYVAVDLKSCTDLGLVTDASTVAWWETQPVEIRAAWDNDGAKPLNVALSEFNRFVRNLGGSLAPWSNGADFDLVLLRSAHEALHADAPWKYYNQRCFRTLRAMAPPVVEVERAGAHHALEDAKYQARVLQEILGSHGLELR